MVERVFLSGVEIEKGLFDSESSVGVRDCNGHEDSGFFDKTTIHPLKGLEVNILDENEEFAVVGPVNGHAFINSRSIKVKKNLLKYDTTGVY